MVPRGAFGGSGTSGRISSATVALLGRPAAAPAFASPLAVAPDTAELAHSLVISLFVGVIFFIGRCVAIVLRT